MGRRLEVAQERRARRRPLDEDRVFELGGREPVDLAKVRVAREEDERTARRQLQDPDDLPRRAPRRTPAGAGPGCLWGR